MSFKKKVLIEPELFEMLQEYLKQKDEQSKLNRDIVDTAIVREEDKMESILNSPSTSNVEKINSYNESLNRYLNYRQKKDSPIKMQPPDNFVEHEILSSAPLKLKNKAKILLERLNHDPNISWNKKGEVSIKGELLQNSNINDLIQDMLRNRKSHVPNGWESFARYLHDSNVPQDLIGNRNRWQWMNKPKTQVGGKRRLTWSPY